MTPSPYEQEAIRAITLWRNPSPGMFSAFRRRLDNVWSSATDLAKKVPGVEWTIDNIVTGLLELVNEISHDTVWRDGILKEFERTGTSVATYEEVRDLDLERVDAAIAGLETKYQTLAGAEGAVTGFAGFAGIVPDIMALVAMNLRAAGEYATYCGFDITSQEERLFALELLDYVAGPSDHRKDVTLEPAIRVAKKVAQSQGVQALEQMGFNEAVERVARAIGLHLTGRKLSQVVPVAGAAVGASLNVLYTRKVCETAFNLYRERFLLAKYGPAAFDSAA